MSSTQRTIYVPGYDKWVTLAQYVRAIKQVKSLPPETVWPHGLTHWAQCSGAQIMRQFRAGMHNRINTGIPYSQRGF